jgi:S-adenosylmethionine synthetase
MDPKQAFTDAVKEYINITNQIAKASKELSQVRRKKDELSDVILEYMKQNNIDGCNSNGMSLQRRETTRKGTIKETLIFETLSKKINKNVNV